MAHEKSLKGNAVFVQFKVSHLPVDGEELMDYLYRRGEYPDALTAPRPG